MKIHCIKWRPLALKGICECGQRWHKHRMYVKADAIEAQVIKRRLQTRYREYK